MLKTAGVSIMNVKHTVAISGKLIIKKASASRYIYLLFLPCLVFLIVFRYAPMYGVSLAFKNYDLSGGVLGSPWVGFENFKYIFGESEFWRVVFNTIEISFQKILITFPMPILIAILLNELALNKYRRVLQTIYTFPHFISWIIISGVMFNLLGYQGMVNNTLDILGFNKIQFFSTPALFRPILYISSIIKESGYTCIIYLAAIVSINPELYEAATVDGANRFQKIRHIIWPGIRSTAFVLLILAAGNVMNGGFEQIFNLYNPTTYEVGDIIDTYVYRLTFEQTPNYGVSTAVGLFKSVINFILVITANKITKMLGEDGIM